jgi:hypothetical protein
MVLGQVLWTHGLRGLAIRPADLKRIQSLSGEDGKSVTGKHFGLSQAVWVRRTSHKVNTGVALKRIFSIPCVIYS